MLGDFGEKRIINIMKPVLPLLQQLVVILSSLWRRMLKTEQCFTLMEEFIISTNRKLVGYKPGDVRMFLLVVAPFWFTAARPTTRGLLLTLQGPQLRGEAFVVQLQVAIAR